MNNVVEIDKLTLEGRKRLNMTLVTSVDSYSEQILRLTVGQNKVSIIGENLKIEAFNKQSGNLTVDGSINEIKYNVSKKPILKRLFK